MNTRRRRRRREERRVEVREDDWRVREGWRREKSHADG